MPNSPAVCGPLSSFSRVRILHLVQTRSHRTIGELCEATGLHANTVREHLQRLIEGGYVIPSVERRTTRGRPRTLYTAATGAPDASSPVAREKVTAAARRGDLMRRLLRTEESALGREATYQLDALVEHLEESGFEPVVDERELTVELTPCPHAASQPVHRPVLCQVHLGLMQGVLAEARGPLMAAGVREAARPEECTVQLATAPLDIVSPDVMTPGGAMPEAVASGAVTSDGVPSPPDGAGERRRRVAVPAA